MDMKVAIISHGHPELSHGGVEHFSYTLFNRLKQVKGLTPTYIARVSPSEIGHDAEFGAFRGRKDEIIWSPPPINPFRLSSLDFERLRSTAKEIFDSLNPDIVHIQHFSGTGLDLIDILKEDTNSRVVYTFQEYLPICLHNGQMVKKESFRLCYESFYSECSMCFPQHSSSKFFLRKKYILSKFNKVDRFVAPSAFIKERYVQWGVPQDRIEEIDYVLPDFPSEGSLGQAITNKIVNESSEGQGDAVTTFGFFGQITPYKGTNVLLEAARLIPSDLRKHVRIVIFGTKPVQWGEEFVRAFDQGISESSDIVSFFGPYKNDQVVSLMQKMDWTVVPSTWWENSPIVIHEAKAAGRPVLCSNIGGMKEKVRDGVDGVHFLAGSPVDLAGKIVEIASGGIRLTVKPANIAKTNRERLKSHTDLYSSLCAEQSA